MGKANKPTPPKSTTKIHPKKDIMATIYTAKEHYNYKVWSASAVIIVLKSTAEV